MRRNTSILIFIAALVLILTPACALGNLVARDEAAAGHADAHSQTDLHADAA